MDTIKKLYPVAVIGGICVGLLLQIMIVEMESYGAYVDGFFFGISAVILFFCLCFYYRLIGIGPASISRELPKKQNIFWASYAHLGPVFALLGPAETVRLIILPYNVGYYGYSPHVLKPVPDKMKHRRIGEWVNGRHSRSSRVAKKYPIFDMDSGHPSRL